MKIATENYLRALEKAANILGVDANTALEATEASLVKNREVRTNASTDIMSTGNTGYGEETTKTVEYTDELYDMVARMPGLLGMLPGNHGQVTGQVLEGDIIGEAGLFNTATEPTGSQATGGRTTNNAVNTGKTEIKIKGFNTIIAITKKDLFNSKSGYANFYSKIQNRILLSLNRTLEAYILNGDTRTTGLTTLATANVNYYDVATGGSIPAESYYIGGNGTIRYQGIDGNGLGIVGGNFALSREHFLAMLDQVNDYMDDFTNLLWIMSGKTFIKARGLDEYSSKDKSDMNVSTPVISKFEGIEAYIAKHMPSLVGVSGKVEQGTGAANNFITMALIYKYAVQYAFGMDMQFVVTEDSQRIFFDVYAEFGAEVITNKAGLGNTVSVGVFQK